MARKIIGLYHPTNITAGEVANQLFIEISATQIVFLTKSANATIPNALEIFELDTDTIESLDFNQDIKADSKILNKFYQETNCIYNLEEALLIPEDTFSPSAAEDFLALLYGNHEQQLVKYEKPTNGSMMNVYRIKKSVHEWVSRNFVLYKPHHIYTNIIQNIFSTDLPDIHYMKIQFYPQHFIAACVIDHKLHLIQTFQYKTETDILYHILRMIHQLGFVATHSILGLSGEHDTSLSLHKELTKLFNHIILENIVESDFIESTQSNHPLHHFTPFYKLVL